MTKIDQLRAPLLVTWQLTRNCDLACVHCCTDSAPGKRLPGELDAGEAMHLAREIIVNHVPYVMLCGGEPLVVPHFLDVAEALGAAGVQLKIETNGQQFDAKIAERLARLPVRSVQISLDADSEEVYRRQRPGGSLAKAHAACEAARAVSLPLEITFAPTRLNIDEIEAVIERARTFGAFRFNTGKLMRIGTAARLWNKLEPSDEQYRRMLDVLQRQAKRLKTRWSSATFLSVSRMDCTEVFRSPRLRCLCCLMGGSRSRRPYLMCVPIYDARPSRKRGKPTAAPGGIVKC